MPKASKTSNPDILRLQREVLMDKLDEAKEFALLKHDFYDGDFKEVDAAESLVREAEYAALLTELREFEESILKL